MKNVMSEEPKLSKLDELETAFAFYDMSEECRSYVSKLDGSIVHDSEMVTGEGCLPVDILGTYVLLPDAF